MERELFRVEVTGNVVIPRWDSFGTSTCLTIRDPETGDDMEWLVVEESGPGWVTVWREVHAKEQRDGD